MKISVFSGNRAEYGLLDPVLRRLRDDGQFDLRLMVSGSHVVSAFGRTLEEIKVLPADRIDTIDIGDLMTAYQVSIPPVFGRLVQAGGRLLDDFRPDLLLIAGDRHETFALAVAAHYLEVPIVHLFGGDISLGGNLEDSIRHGISKISHVHLVSNEQARQRILRLGEEPWRITNVGSTSIDNIQSGELATPGEIAAKLEIDASAPFLLFTLHPVTTMAERASAQARECLEAMKDLGIPAVLTYPGSDTGSEGIIRALNEYGNVPHFRIRKSLGWKLYLGCMKHAACVVGNSSSGIIETATFRVPCVNVGIRQQGRLRSTNVIDVTEDREAVKAGIQKALGDAAFRHEVEVCTSPYGSGHAAQAIQSVISALPPREVLLRKKMQN